MSCGGADWTSPFWRSVNAVWYEKTNLLLLSCWPPSKHIQKCQTRNSLEGCLCPVRSLNTMLVSFVLMIWTKHEFCVCHGIFSLLLINGFVSPRHCHWPGRDQSLSVPSDVKSLSRSGRGGESSPIMWDGICLHVSSHRNSMPLITTQALLVSICVGLSVPSLTKKLHGFPSSLLWDLHASGTQTQRIHTLTQASKEPPTPSHTLPPSWTDTLVHSHTISWPLSTTASYEEYLSII